MNYFFTADTHFYHTNIIKFCKRPFKNADEMNAIMVERWNKKVKPEDTVFHIGDFGYKTDAESVGKIRWQLNGNIVLVLGNHDSAAMECQRVKPTTFQDMTLYREFLFGKKDSIVLFHYGMRTWHHDLRGAMHLYGHSHGGLQPFGKSFDVGVDCWNFEPLSLDEVIKEMSSRPIGQHPAFENYKPEPT